MRLEHRCLVAFDDGDYEDHVLMQHVRPLSAEEAVQADAALAEDDWAQTPAAEEWNRATYVGDEFQVGALTRTLTLTPTFTLTLTLTLPLTLTPALTLSLALTLALP